MICTLAGAQTNVKHLVEHDLNPETLRRELLAARPGATALFSTDETALYEQMLLEACQGMTLAAGRLDGFATAQARAQLGRQTEMLTLLRDLSASLASWLAGPSEQAARFERDVYRLALIRKLNKLEPFGIDEGDRYTDTLKLTDTFVEPDLLLTVWEEDTGAGFPVWRREPKRKQAASRSAGCGVPGVGGRPTVDGGGRGRGGQEHLPAMAGRVRGAGEFPRTACRLEPVDPLLHPPARLPGPGIPCAGSLR